MEVTRDAGKPTPSVEKNTVATTPQNTKSSRKKPRDVVRLDTEKPTPDINMPKVTMLKQ
jgi:hypothetical protein